MKSISSTVVLFSVTWTVNDISSTGVLLSAKVGRQVDYIMFVIFVPCIETKSKIRLIIFI